jgi:hypothetical protein
VADFMSDGGEQCAIAELHSLGASLYLYLNEAPVWPLDHRINPIVIDEWQIDIKTLLEHEPDDPILYALAEAS